MEELLSKLESLKPGEKPDFIAKLTFALKVLPLVIGTPHQQIIIDCFNDPVRVPSPEFSPEHQPPREWPINGGELITEITERKILLERRIKSMKEEAERQEKG